MVALDLLSREGLPGMSLRKVAAALETGPASLYAYVDNLRELQALVLDRALSDVSIPDVSVGHWQIRLVSLLKSYTGTLINRPGLAQLAMNTIASGPNALRILEALLALFAEAGVDGQIAAWAVDLVSLYATAIAVEESHRQRYGDPLEPFIQLLGGVSARDFPRIYAAREQLTAGQGQERFEWAIEVLLKGVLPMPSTAPAKSI